MVVGPILDALAARKAGTSAVQVRARTPSTRVCQAHSSVVCPAAAQVQNKNNRLLIASLPMRTRVLFWLTNLPYWALAAQLATVPSPLVAPAWRPLQAVAALLIAAVSTAFHGVVLFGGGSASYERLTRQLLILDISIANGYGAGLACCAGLAEAAKVFAVPVLLLTWSAVAKRVGQPKVYAFGHGAWHLLSAFGLWWLLYPAG